MTRDDASAPHIVPQRPWPEGVGFAATKRAVIATAGGVEGALGTKPASVARAGEGTRTRTLPGTGTVREPLDKHAADRQVYSKVLANRSAGASGTTAVTRVLVTLPGMCVHEL